MKIRKRRDQSSFGLIDYALMAAGNCFGAFSAGMAMNQPDVAWFFVYAILGGSLFSLLIRRLLGQTRFVQIDAYVYTAATISAVILTPTLNAFLPGDGIPQDVFTAGWLCWMLTFGSALTWRDRTLLFQAVPTIALFGLVGCYDTFAAAPFMFFGFLLCLATLLGRAHSREMLRQAVESGYFNRADAPNSQVTYPEQSPELYEDIKRGPWRWLAGPEWALASGLVIVFVSLLGAPVIRFAVQPLAGVIKVNTPRQTHHDMLAPSVTSYDSGYEVGRGPIFDAHSKPIPLFVAQLDKIRYMRTATFDEYTGHGWRSTYPANVQASENGPSQFAIHSMPAEYRHTYQISIQPESVNTTILPMPIEATSATGTASQIVIRQDGGGEAVEFHSSMINIDAVESLAQPKDAERNLPKVLLPTLDDSGVKPNVRSFADEAVKGARTDYEKATAIANAIAARCAYSLSAPPVPSTEDAADYFLNKSKIGYCDLFATAMVECARAEGLPARYSLGYLPGAENYRPDGTCVIVDRDYHAWAEIFFKDDGWVVFDSVIGSAETDASRSSSLSPGSWTAGLTTVLNTLIVLVTVGLVGAWLLKNRRMRTRRKTIRSEIEREYVVFANALRRVANRRRMPSQTPEEYLESVLPLLNGSGEPARRITAKFVSALFAYAETPEPLLYELRTEVREFVKSSKKAPRK